MTQHKFDENQLRFYEPFIGPHDPCPPILVKSFVVPPNQYITFQPPNLPQFSLQEALRYGTLWPALFSPYQSKHGMGVS
ncbi:spore coat associated protein CotJA [Paenibacillus protaetiae]|uniref:Spore coat associated protein CotJA n=1 Tax=Paenibacillus protaetiae TaxID=2509456 RepID=A0A4V0YER1_9BACL|nr:spore coat associated protein CotJA [Paenibacillus protaetiae]QAY65091.1 spore coat associated protein CotJA [Paenibacillus protaetiae]